MESAHLHYGLQVAKNPISFSQLSKQLVRLNRSAENMIKKLFWFFLLLSFPTFAEVLEEREFQVDKTSISIKRIGCEGWDAGWGSRSIIRISGRIGPDAVYLLRQTLQDMPNISYGDCSYQTKEHGEQQLPEHLVFLTSDGGFAKDGIALGKYLREIRAVTVADGMCSSACAFAYLGGIRRDLEGQLLFHMPYNIEDEKILCQERTEHIRTYYRSMLGATYGDMLYDRTRLYCSASDGWTISDRKAARLYGLETVEEWERGFDVSGAFGAGYSYCEIAEHLAKDGYFDVEGARKAGASCAEIADFLAKPRSWQEG
jgi:hypothetical protein